MKIDILILVALVTTACSTDPTKTTGASEKNAQTDPSTGKVCTYERPTGSFMKEKRCTTAAEREAARQQQGLMDTRNQRDSGSL